MKLRTEEQDKNIDEEDIALDEEIQLAELAVNELNRQTREKEEWAGMAEQIAQERGADDSDSF